MKKTLLFLIAVFFAAVGAFAQCEAPSNFEAQPYWNRVNLSWESSTMGFLDTLTYNGSYSIRIGTNDADTFTVAVRFTPAQLSASDGQYLSHVAFVPGEASVHEFTIKVWVGGSHPDDTTFNEGTLVSSEVVLPSQVTTATWNVIPLTTPVLIDATQELWIGYECTATGGYPAGAGADNVINGQNDLIAMHGGNWTTLASSNLTYAWCIMGYTKDLSIDGFNILRNNVQLNTSLITDHSYIDTDVLPENQYCYTIQSVCASSTANSNEICVTTPVQPNCGPLIGNGTGTTYQTPFNTFYKYSYVQEIFTAAEIGATEGTIESLSFSYFHTTPITQSEITVYLGNVSNQTFASTSSWIPATNLMQVFHGSVYCSNADSNLVTIDFDDAFEWDGQSNIVVAILNGQGSYVGSEARFHTHTTSGNTVLYAYTDSSPYNLATLSTGYLSSNRNNMKFCFGPEPSCFRPRQFEITAVSSEGATLRWQRHSSDDSQWEVVVVPAGTSVNNGNPIPVNDTIHTLTGLDENAAYDVYVRAVCSQDDQSAWVQSSFRTQCVSIVENLPYEENFTDYGTGYDAFPYCWQRFTNHESISYPYISAANINTGQLVLFSNASTYSIAISQGLDLSDYPAGSLALSYWIACTQSYYGRLDVGIMTNPNDLNSFTLLKSYYPTDYDEVGYFQQETILLSESYTDVVYLAFMAPESGNNSSNTVIISHVKVDMAPACTAPSHLAVSHVEGTSAIINWQEAPIGATSYTLAYGETGQALTSVTVNNNDYMLTGLTQGTSYEVMLFSNCSSGEADTLTTTFTTLSYVECLQADTSANAITGTTPTTTYNFPVSNFYNYSYTQQIYTANEISSNHTPMVITGVAFDYAYSTPNSDKNNVKIYLAHRSTNSFASTTDWTPISDATLVYEGSLVCTQGWNNFTFDTDFPYNGNDNLVLILDDNSGAYDGSSYVFNAHTLTTYSSMYYQSDGTNPDPAAAPSGTRSYTRNDVKFFICSQTAPISCPGPYVYVTDADYESITVAWEANGSESTWALEYKAEGSNSWISESNVTVSPYVIHNLSADVHYEIRMQALCSTTDSSEWVYVTAYTPCESVELPLIENFDSYNNSEMPACWVQRSNTSTAAPYITSAQAYSGSKSLYFYCPSNGNYAYAISPKLDEGSFMDSLQIMFYAYTATAGYFIEVGIMSDPNNLNSFTTLGQFNPSAIQTWELGEILSRGFAGEGKHVAFRVPQWYANSIYIDDIDIRYIPSCMHVEDITVSNITPYTADISWTAGGSESQWNYIVGPAGTVNPENDNPILVNSNNISLTDLSANTLYEIYVQAYCAVDEQSSWMRGYFRTECAAMASLPYEENFDTYTGTTSTSTNVLPNCWERINGGTSYTGLPTIYNSSSYAHSGHNSLYFYTYNSTAYADQYATLPEIDTTVIPMNTLQLAFAARSSSTSYTFNVQVGVMSDPSDASTFQLVELVTVSGTSYTNHEVYFNNFNGNGNYIALKVEIPTSGYNYGYVDDIVLDVIPSCSPVHDLTVSNLAGSSALISWSSGHFGTISSYTLEYSEAGQENWITASNNITTTSYMLSGLEPTTSYDVRVHVNCEDGEESVWAIKTFTTRCLAGGELAIGNGTTTNSYLPSYSTYNYSYTQQLFTAVEMGGPTNITSVSFNMANLSQQRSFKIYMMHTTETAIATWIPTANAQLVFDDNQTLVQGWNSFEFTTPFAYNGTDNLVLVVVDETGSWVSGNSWYVHNGSANCARYAYTDSAPYSISTVPSTTGTALSVRNNVIFGGNCDSTATCFAPNMYIGNVDTTSAEVIWVPGYGENSWELEYAIYSDSNWIPVPNPTGGLVTLDQLNANTHYKVRMRSDCGGGDYSTWVMVDFRTECGMASIPYTEDFNSYGTGTTAFPDCWTKHTTYTTTSYPYISTTNNSGTTGGSMYYYASATSYNITVMPELNTDVNTLEVSFYLRVGTISNGMIVGVMNDATDFDSFVPVDTVFCTATSDFQYQEVDLNNYTGTGKFIAFKTYIISTGALYVDDIYIDLIPSCKRPDNVTVSNIDTTSAVVAWTERGNATAWEIEYGPVGFTPGNGTTVPASTNPFTLTGLTAGTEYDVYVRANCGGGDISGLSLNHATFTTDNNVTPPTCHVPSNVTTANVNYNSADVNWTAGGSETAWNLQYKTSSASAWGNSIAVTANNYHISGLAAETTYQVRVQADCGNGNLSDWTTPVNFTTPTAPNDPCNTPTSLTISNITQNTATASWTAGGSESSWNLQYRPAAITSDWENITNITEPYYTLTGLNANSSYQVRVQAVCENSSSEWTLPPANFTTLEVGIDNLGLSNSISLMPNPADNHIELRVNSTVVMKEAVVYNAFGQLIQTIQLTDNHARIDLSEMAAGMYFVRVNGEDVTATKKFIKR